jgi:serine/threonine protein kinase
MSALSEDTPRGEATAAGCGEEKILFRSELTRVFRREAPGYAGIIVKQMLGPNAGERLRHERRILERLVGLEGVPRLVPGCFAPQAFAMEDTRSVPLAALLRHQGLQVPALLQLALNLSQILAAVHQKGVAHKSLAPANLLISGELKPTLIDFSLATTFAEERPSFVHHRDISGVLAYLAPEQTGRTGRPVDQRADLYALGATLYELATGRPPSRGRTRCS